MPEPSVAVPKSENILVAPPLIPSACGFHRGRAGTGSVFNSEDSPMAYTLPTLPYPANSLEPYIDAMTMEIHHGRHHKTYVDNVNKALEGQTALQSKNVVDLLREINKVPENIRTAVRNN